MMVDSAVAYGEEVRTLRRRVALLEAELAASKASAGDERPAPPVTPFDLAPVRRSERSVSEFTEALTPAVMAVAPATQHEPCTAETATHQTALATVVPTELAAPESNPGFAQAWRAQDTGASFEERVAEKAFFQASTIDDESRSWLLEH
ncbi:MAG: hypothetical protein ACI88C_002167 [Acidimicrobiales bacterium]|jgi:hypothetical protein